ncbi:RmlC-like cupin [Coccomyxa subellipsoidea C-169]|uniref:RmlC-like cupin n=1 Tax=Coccomyxa subellipsoidea (strain C-169) TaxID=574566 RepID=I0YNG4_COCSC|nr:RmlC-like cupin [Coccomyxa subellipsoidea C-169]EIE19933.1 RmlC-like cupin [Coccomyxa subellipsoidea C-169]|eukprot:XP_005644477.1 RmlC-like cupin [Coccomyxa subellipsoidea C-169]
MAVARRLRPAAGPAAAVAGRTARIPAQPAPARTGAAVRRLLRPSFDPVNKRQSQRAYMQRRRVYNGNNTSKVAIALSDSEVLCGFVEYQELVQILASTPELGSVLGEVAPAIQALTKRLQSADSPLTEKEKLVLRLNEQSPADTGILSAFFLNFVALKPNQAICVAANVPYAHVSGDLLDCIDSPSTANGFAPTFRDAAAVSVWLTHSQGSPKIFEGTEPSSSRPCTVTYKPPIGEFEFSKIKIPRTTKFSGQQESIRSSHVPQTLYVQGGQGRIFKRDPVRPDMHTTGDWRELELHKGGVVLIPANTSVVIETFDQGLDVWVAAVESPAFKQGVSLARTIP